MKAETILLTLDLLRQYHRMVSENADALKRSVTRQEEEIAQAREKIVAMEAAVENTRANIPREEDLARQYATAIEDFEKMLAQATADAAGAQPA